MDSPFAIFPEEIWEMVIDKIGNSHDRHSILVASPTFREKFQDRVPKWLFASILPIISTHLGIKGVIFCRRICKLWNLEIHSLVADHSYHQPYNEDPENELPVNTERLNSKCPFYQLAASKPVLHFRTAEPVNQFMEMLPENQLQRLPIFGHTLFLDPKASSNNSRAYFEQSSLQLLSRIGDTLSHLIISSNVDFESPVEFYKRLQLSLQLTPNLKTLSLDLFWQTDTRCLSLFMSRRPLPKLPLLQFIRLKKDHIALDIVDALMSYASRDGSKVRKLALGYMPWENPKHYICFVNLTELELFNVCEKILYRLRDIVNAENNALQKLTICCTLGRREIGAAQVFENCKGASLRVLDFSGCVNQNIPKNCPVKFPMLHTLILKDSIHVCYHFLTKLPSLNKLEILHGVDNIINTVSVEQRLGLMEPELRLCKVTVEINRWIYEGPVKGSKIWTFLPALNELCIIKLQVNKTVSLERFLRPKSEMAKPAGFHIKRMGCVML